MLSIPCIVRHGDPSGLTQADQAQQLGQFGQTLSHPDCAIKRQTLLELLRGTGLSILDPIPCQRGIGSPFVRGLVHVTAGQVPQQERFVRRLLPYHCKIIVARVATRQISAGLIAFDLIGVEEDISSDKRLAVSLDPLHTLDRHFDSRVWVPGTLPEIAQLKVKRHVAITHQITQPSRIGDLASPFPTDKDGRTLRARGSRPPHPICGTAP
ncbi:hypothetical protein [Sphingomonas echinoides]|jgi:hypothetical protein|uniref:hypothetical protein n=1 Tax=Sphingomonas echinoides TaxID=59803 RepID=UPI003EE8D6E2